MSRDGPTTTTDRPPRGSVRLLADPAFGPFFAAKLLGTAGVWIHNIVAAILAYELSGSALVVGMVSVAQFGPQLLLAPLSGAMADRGDRRRQVVAGKLVTAAGSGGLAIALALVGVDGLPGAWPVVVAALVVGIGFVLVAPAQNALIPALVRPGELPVAVALNALPPTLARAAGPAVGALIAVSVGPATAFSIAAVTNLVFALVLLRLRIRTRADGEGGTDPRIRAGLRYLGDDRASLLLLAGVAAIGVGADPVITLTPALAAGFGEGSALVGTFASSFGVGAGLAFVVLSSARRWLGLPRVATSGLLLLAGGIAAAGWVPAPAAVTASFVVAGVGFTCALTSFSTLLQERLPDALRGRVMALWSIAFLGSRPIAAAMNGAVADATGAHVAVLLVATLILVAAWWARPAALRRHPMPTMAPHGRRGAHR